MCCERRVLSPPDAQIIRARSFDQIKQRIRLGRDWIKWPALQLASNSSLSTSVTDAYSLLLLHFM